MTDLYVEGPDVIRLLSDLGVNTFGNAAVNKAKQFVACNHDGYVIRDGILFYLDENRVSLVGRRPARNWVHYHAETGGYDVTVERDERTAVNPTGRRKLYRFQVQGRPALDVLGKATGGPLPEIRSSTWASSRSRVTRSARCTTGCPARRPGAVRAVGGARGRQGRHRRGRAGVRPPPGGLAGVRDEHPPSPEWILPAAGDLHRRG